MPRPALPGKIDTVLMPKKAPGRQAGITSTVPPAPAGSATASTWRGGTSTPAAKARRKASIRAGNGRARRVASASIVRRDKGRRRASCGAPSIAAAKRSDGAEEVAEDVGLEHLAHRHAVDGLAERLRGRADVELGRPGRVPGAARRG